MPDGDEGGVVTAPWLLSGIAPHALDALLDRNYQAMKVLLATLFIDGESYVATRPQPGLSDRPADGAGVVLSPMPGTVRVVSAVPGQAVDADDLRVVEVALGPLEDAYASPATLTPGAVATRTVAAGELVPRDAVGDAAQARTTTIVIRSATAVPAAVAAGATVEVWAAPQLERGVYDTPRILVASATVVSVDRDESMMGSAGTAVELVISRADVAAALAAIADGSSLSVVPSSGTTP